MPSLQKACTNQKRTGQALSLRFGVGANRGNGTSKLSHRCGRMEQCDILVGVATSLMVNTNRMPPRRPLRTGLCKPNATHRLLRFWGFHTAGASPRPTILFVVCTDPTTYLVSNNSSLLTPHSTLLTPLCFVPNRTDFFVFGEVVKKISKFSEKVAKSTGIYRIYMLYWLRVQIAPYFRAPFFGGGQTITRRNKPLCKRKSVLFLSPAHRSRRPSCRLSLTPTSTTAAASWR